MRILESDPVPRYWLSLSVYQVSGITNGLRAEWSTYVDDGTGVPRFMIVRARAANGSIDPIGPLAYPEPFDHILGISVDLADVTLVDDSEWALFVEPAPAHVLVYLDKIQFAIAPWWNVTEPDGLVDPVTLASLFEFKKGLYGSFAATQALGVRLGSADPVV